MKKTILTFYQPDEYEAAYCENCSIPHSTHDSKALVTFFELSEDEQNELSSPVQTTERSFFPPVIVDRHDTGMPDRSESDVETSSDKPDITAETGGNTDPVQSSEEKKKSRLFDEPPKFHDFLLGAVILIALALGGITLTDLPSDALMYTVAGVAVLSIVFHRFVGRLGQLVKTIVISIFGAVFLLALAFSAVCIVVLLIIMMGKGIWNFFTS